MNISDRASSNTILGNSKENKIANRRNIASFSTAMNVANHTIINTTTTTTTTCTTTATSSSTVPKNVYSTGSPTEIDVLCGRGGAVINHPGNRAFLALVDSKRPYYQSIQKPEKRKISKLVVNTIQEKGGRFLRKRESTDVPGRFIWCEIDDEQAIAKTAQALRERKYKKMPSNFPSNPIPKIRVFSTRTTQGSKKSPKRPSQTANKKDRKVHSHKKQATPVPRVGTVRAQNSSSSVAKVVDHRIPPPPRQAMISPMEGTNREPIAMLNGLNYLNGNGSWEWKLFDFCDEEQTRQDDQLVPHYSPLRLFPAPAPDPTPSSSSSYPNNQLPFPALEHRQYQPEMLQMVSSPRLYGYPSVQALAPPASLPEPTGVPVKRESAEITI